MPDEDGFYTIDDMKLTRKQMLEYFDLIPREHFSGLPEYKWPGIEARGISILDNHTPFSPWSTMESNPSHPFGSL